MVVGAVVDVMVLSVHHRERGLGVSMKDHVVAGFGPDRTERKRQRMPLSPGVSLRTQLH